MDFLIWISYAVELILTELVFMQGHGLRKKFVLRAAPWVVCAIGLSWLHFSHYTNSLPSFMNLLLIIAFTVAAMASAYRCSFSEVLSACTSGVALQHIAHHTGALIGVLFSIKYMDNLREFIIVVVFCVLLGYVLRKARRTRENHVKPDLRFTVLAIITVLICIGITRFTRVAWDRNPSILISISLYAITCCCLALFMSYFLHNLVASEKENAVLQRIREEEKRQYEISQNASEQLHIIYHDLRHKLTALEGRLPRKELDSMRESLENYGAVCNTGLEALDVVLNEKIRQGQSKGIQLSFMGNGEYLAFMDQMEIYSMFGNLLDNALTAAEKLALPGQKVIGVVIERKGNLVLINVTNYLGDKIMTFSNGLPVSTKEEEPGYHGYGLRSVRAIAKKYDGDLMISTMEGIFNVNVYLMHEQP